MIEFHPQGPSQEMLIEVGRSTITGKWHARITTEQGVHFYSPPCDSESEAMECKESALQNIQRQILRLVEMPFRLT